MMYNETTRLTSPYQEKMSQQREREMMEGGYGTIGGGTTADIRSSGLPYQLQAMEKNMACLIEAISILQGKLNPILRPQPETAMSKDSNRSLGDSELASFLARANISLEEQTRRINALIQGADL